MSVDVNICICDIISRILLLVEYNIILSLYSVSTEGNYRIKLNKCISHLNQKADTEHGLMYYIVIAFNREHKRRNSAITT